MKNLIVDNKYNNKKLNTFLLDKIPNISINTIYKLLRKKDIKINGIRVNSNVTIHNGDEILVYISDDALSNTIKLDIIYEDNNILIINKPYNLETTGTSSLTTHVHNMYSNNEYLPMPCHRLDRNTTGLVLFAKNEEALNILLDKFKNHEIEKHYLALVYGIPKIKNAKLESYLFKDNKKSMVYISDDFKKGYQKIITSYTVLETFSNNTSLLDVQIETGKTHQIRAHLAHIGYPIIGDGKYGINKINKEFKAKYQKLCSYKLKFNFTTNSGILDYLNNKTFELKSEKRI
jgi:23S rRNA pseudouridine955/2504/2580 synthase